MTILTNFVLGVLAIAIFAGVNYFIYLIGLKTLGKDYKGDYEDNAFAAWFYGFLIVSIIFVIFVLVSFFGEFISKL